MIPPPYTLTHKIHLLLASQQWQHKTPVYQIRSTCVYAFSWWLSRTQHVSVAQLSGGWWKGIRKIIHSVIGKQSAFTSSFLCFCPWCSGVRMRGVFLFYFTFFSGIIKLSFISQGVIGFLKIRERACQLSFLRTGPREWISLSLIFHSASTSLWCSRGVKGVQKQL